MLKIEKMTISYGKDTILRDININFKYGRLYGIIGPNGAGKSTLLNTISRDLKINSGDIFIDGSSIYDYSQREMAKKLSYMRQSISIKFPYTVKELVTMGRYCHDRSNGNESKYILEEKIKENNLETFSDKPLTELSGGEVQRAIFVKTLVQNSNIILIDEGLSNADIFYKVNFFQQLKREVKKGKMIIMVIHDLFLARKFCDELIILNKNSIYANGKSSKVLNSHTLKEVFKVEGDFINESLVLK